MIGTFVLNLCERRRQRELAETRPALDANEFTRRLVDAGAQQLVAQFVWNQFQPYYFAPLTPYPEDRPISEMRIDSDDLSEIITTFEKQFGRKWLGQWVGPADANLAEFAVALVASTNEQ